MTDYDGKRYTALFEQFQVIFFRSCLQVFCKLLLQARTSRTNVSDILKQVGQGDHYALTVGGFNAARSTLGDSMAYSNGMKFSTK